MSSNPSTENTKTRLAAGRAADRVLRTRQGGGAGAAVCYFQAPHLARRKYRAPQPVYRKHKNPPGSGFLCIEGWESI